MTRPFARSMAVLSFVLATACGDDEAFGPEDATLITLPANLTGLSSAQDGQKLYRVVVPAGQSSLNVSTNAGTGDVDLYVREGIPATKSNADCISDAPGNAEACPMTNPEAGDWYILLDALTQYAGVTLSVTITP